MTLKLKATTGGGSVSLSAPNSTTSNLDVDLTLPVDDGNSGQVLQTNGSGVLSWATVSSDAITEGNTSAEVIDTGSDGRFIVTADGTERLRVDSGGAKITSGALHIDGLGNPTNNYITLRSGTSPSTAGGSGFKAVDHSGANEDGLGCFGHDGISFYTAQTERARINNSGRLLIGTTSARNVTPLPDSGSSLDFLTFEGVGSSATSGLTIVNNDGNYYQNCSHLTFVRTGGNSVGSNTAVSNGYHLGAVNFAAADGTDVNSVGARIYATIDGTPGSNDVPGRLIFATTADGASSPTARMYIKETGKIGINASSPNAYLEIYPEGAAGNTSKYVALLLRNPGQGNVAQFYADAGNIVGNINVTGSATQYNTSSDYRLKENVVDLDDAINRLIQIPVKRFNFIADPSKTVDGFIAHEIQTVVPEAITGEKDAVDDNGDPVYQGIDQSKLVPLLTAALQEAIGRIETLEVANASLEARLTALEGGAS